MAPKVPVPPPPTTRRSGIDALLTSRGKALFVGQEVRLTLIKTASGIETFDPVNAQAPAEPFPVVAKFPESVVKPNFKIFKRFYQQDIPSQKVRFHASGFGLGRCQDRQLGRCPDSWKKSYTVSFVSFFPSG